VINRMLLSVLAIFLVSCSPSGVHSNDTGPLVAVERPASSGPFRKLEPKDLCASVTVYTTPNGESELGMLVEEFERYRDPATGRLVNAVMVSALIDHHVKGIWKTKKQLSALYVRSDDGNLKPCSWSVRKEEVSPLQPDEIPLVLDPAEN
jgi:hypothetical protein